MEPESLKAVLSKMADGDLSRSELQNATEADSVAGAVSRVQERIGRIVGQVRQSSDLIATGSAEIATGTKI